MAPRDTPPGGETVCSSYDATLADPYRETVRSALRANVEITAVNHGKLHISVQYKPPILRYMAFSAAGECLDPTTDKTH
jgi:hypothetical protein